MSERRVVWLAGTAPFHRRLTERFASEFPDIACETAYLNGTESVSRFRRERADVLASGLDEAVPVLRQEGLLADLRGRKAWKLLPAAERDPHGSYVFFAAARSVLVYDPRKVPDPPRSYEELADPSRRGATALVNPKTCGFGVVFLRYAAAQASLGPEWIRKLGSNGAVLLRQTSHVVDAVAHGESLFGIARDAECRAAKEAGASIAWLTPKEGPLLQRFPACLRADAPHPVESGVFIDWLVSAPTRAFLQADGCGVSPTTGDWVSDLETKERADTAGFAEEAVSWLEGQ